jgi:hypothetical protein
MEKWPNFFIVGAPKSGTTSLYEYLKQIPEFFFPSIKEPNFFSVNLNQELLLTKPIRQKEKYLSLYQNARNEKFLGDASPTYLWDPDAARLISEKSPNAKIIILLRNPVSRAFSHYLFLVSFGAEILDFEAAIKNSLSFKDDYRGRIIEGGRYEKQIKNYLKFFKRDQIHFIIFEEFITNTEDSLRDTLKFLDIDYDLEKINFAKSFNEFSVPRNELSLTIMQNDFLRKLVKNFVPGDYHPHLQKIFDKSAEKPIMKENLKKELRELYRDDISYVEKLLERNLPW